MTRYVALGHAPAGGEGASRLYPAQPPGNRILMWISRSDAREVPDLDPAAQALAADGWHLVYAPIDPGLGAEAAAAAIVDVLADAVAQTANRGAAHPRVVIVADGLAVAAAATAALSRRHGKASAIEGLIAIDPVFDGSTGGSSGPDLDVAAVVAVHRSTPHGREQALAYHRYLQSRGRETQFLVLRDDGRSAIARLGDACDPFGSVLRRLLEPVHSRTD